MIRGLVIGKFLPYHAGHAYLIETARRQVDELVVLVCSIAREPIAGALRHGWVAESHPDCRVVHVAEEVPQSPEESPEFWPVWLDLIGRHAGRIDHVFTSEEYGDELARRLDAVHVQVDQPRSAVPVSGTAIRADPMGNWRFIPPPVRPYFVRRVAIIGPESSGKTTLAAALAASFDTVWVPEFGRAYCDDRHALSLVLDDFDAIGRGQLLDEELLARAANRVLICDTDLATTCTWSDMVVGERSMWLAEAARGQHYGLTLLLSHEQSPWIDDGTRVLETRRAEHLERLKGEMHRCGRDFHLLAGSYEERERAAIALVKDLLSMRSG